MNLQNDTFYSRIPTLSNDELFNYITNYSRYKIGAVQLAITELQSRGFILSDDELSNIESFFSSKSNHIGRRLNFNPSLFRLISYVIFSVGMLMSVVVYITARPPMQNPLGYDPLDTKRYLRELELYGGKSNIMATEFGEWFVGLWQGKNLSYTIACITLIISIILWFIGSRKHFDPDKNLVNPTDP
jgi:ABC-type phosphate/phosphonate transport system permease subunit